MTFERKNISSLYGHHSKYHILLEIFLGTTSPVDFPSEKTNCMDGCFLKTSMSFIIIGILVPMGPLMWTKTSGFVLSICRTSFALERLFSVIFAPGVMNPI